MSRHRQRLGRLIDSVALDEPTTGQLETLWQRVLFLLGGTEVTNSEAARPGRLQLEIIPAAMSSAK